ncbi:hypothetical protein [Pseudoduganella umbonata]|uniref:LPXTG cell wall anchor domain-containing protein n=1 Tax=Pseudoduganella umbonata TaxID=864828 RepID=A0A4P8HN71_9BURK|nr:hypothetical protein [Pseudoduganella umbonata]MBB3219801.1 hypothetical protein [Pseudoduganella umbonata]QCP09840.1 hypothetical protein FCL38_04940 [Pseudoduganella umbonata]
MKRLIPLILLLAATLAIASPGAHGPNGEHLDGTATATGTGNIPRVETFSELFELVGQLSGGELSVMIDRYDTNEPVLGGELDVQYKQLKAKAKFHADMGDYAIDDVKFLKAIGAPGRHALLFTVVANGESDLLEGTLDVPAVANHEHGFDWRWLLLGLLPLTAIAALLIAIRRRRRRHSTQEAAA